MTQKWARFKTQGAGWRWEPWNTARQGSGWISRRKGKDVGKGERLFMPISRHGILLNDLLEAVGHLCVFRSREHVTGRGVRLQDWLSCPPQPRDRKFCVASRSFSLEAGESKGEAAAKRSPREVRGGSGRPRGFGWVGMLCGRERTLNCPVDTQGEARRPREALQGRAEE